MTTTLLRSASTAARAKATAPSMPPGNKPWLSHFLKADPPSPCPPMSQTSSSDKGARAFMELRGTWTWSEAWTFQRRREDSTQLSDLIDKILPRIFRQRQSARERRDRGRTSGLVVQVGVVRREPGVAPVPAPSCGLQFAEAR